MKKRWIVLLLTVALLLGLAVFAMAAGEETQRVVGPNGEMYHCECGAKWFDREGNPTETGTCMDGCSGENLTWLPLSENLQGSEGSYTMPASGCFYLDRDITLNSAATPSVLCIDLNGNTLSRANNRVIAMDEAGDIVTITDTSKEKDGVLASLAYSAGNTGAVVNVKAGTLNLYAGTIDASSITAKPVNGGAVYVASGATFNVCGGTVKGCTTSDKGGTIYSAGTLNIKGGTITGGSATGGGNICQSGGTFTMTGGIVENGTMTSTHGGNIRVDTSAQVYLYGGIIRNGKYASTQTSNGKGANLAIVTAGTAVTVGTKDTAMVIEGGTALNGGAAIYGNAGTLTIGSNAVITNGTTKNGNAECVLIDSNFTSATITGKPQIAEIYFQTAKSQLVASNLDPNARIGLDFGYSSTQKLSTATVDAAVAGCFYSTNGNCYIAHSGDSNIYVYVASTTPGSCICGADNRGTEHTKGCYYILDSQWTSVADAGSIVAPTSGRKVYKLTSDVTLSSALSWSAGHMVIDLNGNKLTTTAARMFTLTGSASLTITDTSVDQTGQVIYSSTSGSDGGIMNLGGTTKLYVFGGTMDASKASIGYGAIARLGGSGTFAYIHGGSILGGKTTGSGGGAFSCVGTIYMTGGSITGGAHTSSTYGGGAIHLGGGKLYMSGHATVSGGSTACSGGVILLRGTSSSTAILSMTDNASVTGGTATVNGATVSVRLDANGTTTDTNPTQLIMSGNASITGGTATKNGGAVYINSGTTVTISGNASITGGTAVNGGAICSDKGTITMDGGTITGSTVSNQGGAIYMSGSGAQFTMNDGTIVAGNNVPNGGGAVFVGGSSTITMNDGEITAAGKTGNYGMCVCVYGGTFNLYDGTLTGGTATGSGGGALSLASSGKVYMYGGTITGGTHNNATATNGGGNVRVSSGCTMYMYGGTIEEGTSSYNGGNVFVLGTFNMSGNATISGGHSLRGGNVCVFVSSGSAGSFTMDGGTITGGTTAGTNAHGGNIHVREAGTFTMNGGTVSNGTAAGNGGNIAMISTGTKVTINGGTVSGGSSTAASGSSVWVHNGTTTGNVTVSGEPSINNVYLMTGKTVTIGANGLGDKAQIGLEMQTPGAFTAENATNYATRFISLSDDYYVVPVTGANGITLQLVAVEGYEGVVAIVGSTPFDTAQGAVDAVTDSDNQYVKLMAAVNGGLTINKNLYLDLNGNTITGNINNTGFILYAFDSATDDYIASDTYGKIVGTISGEYSGDFVTPNVLFGHQYRYVAINEGNNTYSFHRIYMGVKSVVLYPTTTAIDYKVTLRCDEVVAQHITAYGVKAYATAYQTAEPDSAVAVSPAQYGDVMANGSVIKPYGAEGNENIFKVRIAKILNDGMDAATQELRAERFFFTASAYIVLDGQELTSSGRTNSLEDVVKKTEELVSAGSISLNTNQKYALATMYTTFNTLMEPWFEEFDAPVIPSMVEVTRDYLVHCLCGDESSTNNPCANAGHPDQAWEPWDGTTDITVAGNYYLTQDLGTESANYQKNMGSLAEANQPGTINLDLYGHSITSENRVFGVGTNITFNLVNSGGTSGVITGKNSGDTAMGGVIFTQPSSTISLYPNVTVDGSGASVKYGGAIYAGGNLNIYGAAVTGADLTAVNYSEGGAIYLVGTEEKPVSMTMNNGIITGNSVKHGGGAVQLADYATLTMNGGNIDASGVTSGYGAAIRMETANTYFNMKGGTLTGGTSTGSGGGAISCAGTIKMTGGTIQNGKFTGTGHGGGNIRINAGAKMTMTGGTISGGESAYRGGNIYLLGEFEMSGGRIVDGKTNGFNGHGGNIHVRDGASFTMTEGAISGGQALGTDSDGGNIAIIGAETQIAVSGGTISGGKSTRTGPSVWLHTGTLSVSGTPAINDVYLLTDQYITISGNLTSSASIGITKVGGEGRFTTDVNATAANAAYFHSTDPSLRFVCVGEEGLQLSAVNVYSVGYGAASIDPDLTDGNSYLLLGYSNQDRIATAIDDSDGNASNGYDLGLLATCLAVTDAQGDTVLLISVDAASMGSVTPTVKNQITKATGVPAENIMISAAHQHSTPDFTSHYLNTYFYPGIVQAAQAAMADRKTVTGINTSTVATTDTNGNPQFGFVRNISLYKDGQFQGTWSPNHDDRVYGNGKIEDGVYINYESTLGALLNQKVEYKICSSTEEAMRVDGYAMCYETIIDSDLQLVKFTRADASDVVMANFQVHPLLSSNENTTVISADVVGVFRNQLAESTGAKVMYFSGASGNINPTSYIGDTVYKKTADEGKNIGTAHIDHGTALAGYASQALVSDYTSLYTNNGTGYAGDVKATSKLVSSFANTNKGLSAETIARAQEIFSVAENKYTDEWSESDKTNYGIYSKFHAKYIAQRATVEEGTTRDLTISAYSLGDIAIVAAPYEMFCENGQKIKADSEFAMTFVATQANGDNGYIPSAAGYENGGYSTDITRFAAGTGEALVAEYLTLLSSLKTAN